MRKIFTALAMLAVLTLYGSPAHAAPAYPTCAELGTASGWCTLEDGTLAMHGGANMQPTPTTECGDVTESGVVVGDNAAGCGYPAPPVEEPTVPETPTAPETVPEAYTAPEPVTVPTRTELAYTGPENAVYLGIGLALITIGALMIRRNRGVPDTP